MRKGIINKVVATAMAAAVALTSAGISANASEYADYDDFDLTEVDEAEAELYDYEKATASGYTPLRDENGDIYDLGGMKIIIRDWWFPGDSTPSTAYEKAYAEHEKWVEETYNFKIERTAIGDWNSVLDDFDKYVKSGGDSKNYIFTLRQDSSMTDRMSKGYCYDLSTLDCLDFTKTKYSKNKVAESYGLYAMRDGIVEPKTGIIFNKTLLEKIGVNVDNIYSMQKNGTWTWSEFEKILDKVQDYSDAHASEKIAAFDCNEGVFTQMSMYSNTGHGLVKPASSGFGLTLDDKNTYDSLAWAMKIYETYTPASSYQDTWDRYQKDFQSGKLAFTCDYEYTISPGQTFSEDKVKGDIGYVVFPKGPKMSQYTAIANDNFYVIPSCYSKAKAWKIAFAFDVLTEPIKGYEDYNPYVNAVASFVKDKRVSKETIPIMSNALINNQLFFDSFVGDTSSLYWSLTPNYEGTVADLIREVKPEFARTLSSNNSKIGKRYNYKVVTFNNNGHGDAMNTRYVYSGTGYSFRKAYAPGYVFMGWYTDKACTSAFNGTVKNDMTLYAKWSVCKHSKTSKKTTKASTKKDGQIVETCTSCKATVKKTTIPKAYVLVPDTATYTGKAIKSGIKVVDKNNKAISKSNYSLSFSNNVKEGIAKVTVKFKGKYEGSNKYTFVIAKKNSIPAKLTKLSLSAASKGFKATWKSSSKNVKGYEVQYSKDSNFVSGVKSVVISKSSKKSATISGTTAKTAFYVRVRAYNVVNGNKIYSEWTKPVSVTTK